MASYKARITNEDFERFCEFYSDSSHADDTIKKIMENFNMGQGIYECAKRMFNREFSFSTKREEMIFYPDKCENRDFVTLIKYLDANNISWKVDKIHENLLYLNFSGTHMFWDAEFCTLEELFDYENRSIAEIRGIRNAEGVGSMLPAEMRSISIRDVKENQMTLEEKRKRLENEYEDIRRLRTKELQEMDEKIQKLKDELEARKKEMLSEIEDKLCGMRKEMDALHKQVFMLESEIYTIRSYSGETLEIRRVRSGKKAQPDTPLVINQKLMYLDEDLGRIMSIYQAEISKDMGLFADVVAHSEEVFDAFCPQERSLTFFRLSRNATFSYLDSEFLIYKNENLIHGQKMGFLLRDGECAYVGWLDESWRQDERGEPIPVTFTENLLYDGRKTEVHAVGEHDAEQQDGQNTMLSRVFALAVVQGIIDNEKLLEFPEKISITKPGKYIVHNFATGWIMDDRFGDFDILVENLNKRTKVGDQIFVCYNKNYGLEGRGENNRTRDCTVGVGLNCVNLVEKDSYDRCTIYVSAEKKWSASNARANVNCRPNEYINITYMNSIWIKYYIQTKKLGRYANDYAKMIKPFKHTVEIIEKREKEEMMKIKQYFPQADEIPEWQVLLSHWKLNHNIRFVTDFQAKRIASYLQKGEFMENANLFETEEFYKEDATNSGKYSFTSFSSKTSWHTGNRKEDKFSDTSEYGKEEFYIPRYRSILSWECGERKKEKEEENAQAIAEKLPELERRAVIREFLDIEKLSHVNAYVMQFLEKHKISVSELTVSKECTELCFDKKQDVIYFETLEGASEEDREEFVKKAEGEYPPYILQSRCWKIAYYDYVHRQYDRILHDAKMILHRRFLSDTKKST